MSQGLGLSDDEAEGLARRLSDAIEAAGLSDYAVAKASGVASQQIGRLKRGERIKGVTLATVIRIARALGRPVGWLAVGDADYTRARVDDRYPSRVSAVGLATAHGIDEEAIRAVLAYDAGGPDPGGPFWWRLILAEAGRRLGVRQAGNDGQSLGGVTDKQPNATATHVQGRSARIKHK